MGKLFLLALIAAATFACEADYRIWIPGTATADPLYRFTKNGKSGYIDSGGNVVTPPTLPVWGNYGSEFHDGLLEIGVSDGVYVDRTGKVVLDKKLYRGWDFSEGLAVAMREGENLWGYIDTSGEFAISPRFASSMNDDYVWSFADGLARIKVHGKFGYIDHTGNFVIKPELPDGIDFSDGMARVVAEGPCGYFPEGACGAFNPQIVDGGGQGARCKFTYIDKTGKVITAARFDFARDFSEGLAPVKIGSQWGFIDKTGALVVTPRFEDAEPFSSGLSRIKDHGLYGYADKSGALKIAPQFKFAENFTDGLAVVSDAVRAWYIDQIGKRAFDGEFITASPFFKGLANVKLNARTFAYINTKGERIFTY